MASFQKIQELLLPCSEEEIKDDEEFSVFYEAYAPQNLPFQHSAYEKFLSKTKILPNAKLIFLIATYADAILSKGPKGAVVDNCFGFIDRTVRPISRADVKPASCL